MVRIRERDDSDQPTVQPTDGTDSDAGKSTLLRRRSVLKLAGAGAAALATGIGTASAASYETITVPSGETWRYTLSDGETFENKLIDITSENSRAHIVATGSDWTIRNIGIRGADDYTNSSLDSGGSHKVLGIEAHGQCLVEDVYLGDGAAYDGPAGDSSGAMWLSPASTGDLTVRRVYAADFPDNAFYCSSNHGGTVTFDHSFAKNCGNANFRIGNEGDSVNSCSSILDGTSGFGDNSRGVWAWYDHDMYVNDSNVYVSNGGYSFWAGECNSGQDARLHVNGTDWQGETVEYCGGQVFIEDGDTKNPDPDFVPSGCPTTPVEAASGTTSSTTAGSGTTTDTSSSLSNTLRIETDAGADLVSYEIQTSGAIELGSDAETPDAVAQNADGTWTASGVVGDGYADSYSFDGEVLDVTYDNPMTLVVNGTEVDPDVFDMNRLRLETDAGADLVEYEVTTTGTIRRGPASEDPDSASENADGTWTATGLVGDGAADSWFFAGTLEAFTADNPVTVLVNGSVIDTETFDMRTLRIGTDAGAETVEYTVRTAGEIKRGEKAESSDAVSQNADGTWAADGIVGDGYADTYQFDGDLLDFEYDNPVNVAVDGESIDPKTVGPANTLRVQSDAKNVRYRFSASGTIELGDAAENPDSATQNDDGSWSAKGIVGEGYTDTWTFRGYLESFEAKKDITVTVNGETVDPNSL